MDETFQQFALDDSEDDFEDGDSPSALDSNTGGSLHNIPNFDHINTPALKAYSSSPTLLKSAGGLG